MSNTVVIFAGNGCSKDKQEYYFRIAYETGKLLAENGFVVATGAREGLMDECMRGAHEAGGETIGIGLNLEKRQQSLYVKNLSVHDKLAPRQDKLIELGDAYIALPGGIGTLYEIFNIIALKRLHEIPADKPLILIDGYYDKLKALINGVIADGFVDESVHALYQVVGTPAEAVKIIKAKL